MIQFVAALWLCSSALIIASHILFSLLIDGHMKLGLWAKGALIVFSILGPLGVIFEAVLLYQVIKDVIKQTWQGRLKNVKETDHTEWTDTHTRRRNRATLHG